MKKESLMKRARGEEYASFVLKNARIVNVYSGEIEEGDIAIEDGFIIGIGEYRGEIEIDVQKSYVAPGFIDGHVHIESSMLTPPSFAKIIVPKGTTTVIADPHEIANVVGVDGIEFMLESSENIPLNVYMMLPSCVPATEGENSGAVITAEDIASMKHRDRVLGLGEVMDYPAVLAGQEKIHQKIALMHDRIIDGHAPDIIGKDLNAYVAAGVMTDHECTQVESMLERVRRGMYVHLREGSATKNTQTLLKGVTKENVHRLLFCTDDKHPEDIKLEGHINYNVNLAIKHGISPMDAIRMATLNAANCYQLKYVGGIAPGKYADLIVFEDLEQIEPHMVLHRGVIVAQHGQPLFESNLELPKNVLDAVHIDLYKVCFDLTLSSSSVKVIGLIKDNITTHQWIRNVAIKDGLFAYNPSEDILKLAVIESHHHTGNIGLGLVEGFGFKNGAIAMTISHDSHNCIVVGSSDQDMKLAVEKIVELQGGIVLVRNGKVEDALQLEVGGIMTNHSAQLVQETLSRMKQTIQKMGLHPDIEDPFIPLAFLTLPVVPELKLTDRGLFDVSQFKIVPIEEE